MRTSLMILALVIAFMTIAALGLNWTHQNSVQKIEIKTGDILDLRTQKDAPIWNTGCVIHFSEVGATGIALLRAENEMPRSVTRVERIVGDEVFLKVISEPYGEMADFICPAGGTLKIDLSLAKEAKYRTPKGSRRF